MTGEAYGRNIWVFSESTGLISVMEAVFCPRGTFDNSPAIYCWDPEIENRSPGGTAEKGQTYGAHGCFSRPSGTEKGMCFFPTVKTVGYYRLSLRDFRNRNELSIFAARGRLYFALAGLAFIGYMTQGFSIVKKFCNWIGWAESGDRHVFARRLASLVSVPVFLSFFGWAKNRSFVWVLGSVTGTSTWAKELVCN